MSNEQLRQGILFFVVILISLSVHEFSHALAAFLLGDSTAKDRGRLSLNPIRHLDTLGTLFLAILAFQGVGLGWAKPVPVDVNRLRHSKFGMGIVSFAGPISNLILAFISFQCLMVFRTFFYSYLAAAGVGSALLSDVLLISIQVNIALFAFNLFPLYPLDGAKVLSALLPAEWSRHFDLFFLKFGSWPLVFLFLWEWILPFPGPLAFILGPFNDFMLYFLEKSVFWISLT